MNSEQLQKTLARRLNEERKRRTPSGPLPVEVMRHRTYPEAGDLLVDEWGLPVDRAAQDTDTQPQSGYTMYSKQTAKMVLDYFDRSGMYGQF